MLIATCTEKAEANSFTGCVGSSSMNSDGRASGVKFFEEIGVFSPQYASQMKQAGQESWQ